MATTFLQQGDKIEMTAPVGGVVVDVPHLIGATFGIPAVTAAAGAKFTMHVGRCWTVPIKTTDTPSAGDVLYWDDGNTEMTTTASGNYKAGIALEDKASGPATIKARLDGVAVVAEP